MASAKIKQKNRPKPVPVRRVRDLEQTRKEILQASFALIYPRGFQGVSVDDIVAKTSLTKGAFYHHFPTKLDLGYALVEEVIFPMILDRWITPLDAYENPLDGILERMKLLIGDSPIESLALGCPLNNLVQEMAPVDRGFKKRLEKALLLWIEETDRHLQRGKANGSILSHVDTRKLAHFVVMAHEGFYGMLKGITSPEAFDALYLSMKTYFKALA